MISVFTNAQVLLADGTGGAPPTTVVVQGERIAAVGDADLAAAYPGAEVVDLEGRTLVPGINDSHVHLGFFGSTRPPLSLDLTFPKVSSIREVVSAVEEAVADPPSDGWIRGFGWDLGYLEECADGVRMPSREDLDRVATSIPVILQDFSGHTVWVNSEALRRAGVDRSTEPPAGGVILRNADGEPTGLLQEGAQEFVQKQVPLLTREGKRTALRTALETLHAQGVTSVTDGAMGPGGEGLNGGALDGETLELLAELVGDDGIRMRTNVLQLFSPLGSTSPELIEEGLRTYVPPRGKDGWFRIAGVKLFADGIPPNKTAWMHQCYLDGGEGGLTVEGEDVDARVANLRTMVQLIHEAGHQIGVHVTGDRGIEAVTQAFVEAQRRAPRPDPRHYLIHADFASPEVIRTAARHGIGMNMQPAIKWTIADLMERMLGEERASYQWPMRSALDAGVAVASSSDCPITYPNWLQGAAAAVLRESKASGRVFGPEEKISVDEAVQTYSRHGAWQDHAEGWKGTIQPGKVADLCVVEARLLDDDPHDWADAEVAATVVGGQMVHGEL